MNFICRQNTTQMIFDNYNWGTQVHNVKISILIIDEDEESIKKLKDLLEEGGLNTISSLTKSENALKHISEFNPNLIFIDPSINNNSGYELIKQFGDAKIPIRIVIITKDIEHASLKMGFGIIGILKKPILPDNLIDVLIRYSSQRTMDKLQQKLNTLNQAVRPQKLKFSTRKGYIFLEPGEIIYFKADSNYTHIFLKNDKQITVAKSLRYFEESLLNTCFVRISRSVIINTTYLTRLDRNHKVCILKNGEDIRLAITQKYTKPLLENFKCF